MLIALNNALKHSTVNIDARAEQKNAMVESRVQDLGLGLPIARALVEAQGGEIGMESQIGEGSTVILLF